MTCSSGWRPVSRLAFEERREGVVLRALNWGRRIWVRRFIGREFMMIDFDEEGWNWDVVMGENRCDMKGLCDDDDGWWIFLAREVTSVLGVVRNSLFGGVSGKGHIVTAPAAGASALVYLQHRHHRTLRMVSRYAL